MANIKDPISFLMLTLYLTTWNSVTCGRTVVKKMVNNNNNNNNNNNKDNAKVESTSSSSEQRYAILPYVYSATAADEEQEEDSNGEHRIPSTVFLPPPDGLYSANVQSNGNTGHISQPAYRYKDFSSVQIKVPYYHEEPQPEDHRTNYKPIEEPPQEEPKQPIPVDKLTKAAVEPVTIFDNSEQRSIATTIGADSKTEDSSQVDDTGTYEYEYIVEDNHWGAHFGHRENHDGPQTRGKYQVLLPDGRLQSVQYWSDQSGYHAVVTYDSIFKRHHTAEVRKQV